MSKLTDEFMESELEWKPQQTGSGTNGVWAMVLCYVSARAIQNRLDAVFGVLGWRDTYRFEKNGVICELSVYDKEKKEWITKENGSPETDIESFKGGISSAFKRVASSGFGIGRYLYALDTTFAEVSNTAVKGWNQAKTKEGVKFWWKTPSINSVRTNSVQHTQPNTQSPPSYTPNTPDTIQQNNQSSFTPYPASEKQKNVFTNNDINFNEDLDKKTATQVIDLVFKGIKPPFNMVKTEDFKIWVLDQTYTPTNEQASQPNEAVDPFELRSAPEESFRVTLDEVKLFIQEKTVDYLQNNTDELQSMTSFLNENDKIEANNFLAAKLRIDS